MTIHLRSVQTPKDFRTFALFPWSIYKRDAYWVPPLIDEKLAKLDAVKNPFWRGVERQLWIAYREQLPVGTIAAFIDPRHNQSQQAKDGLFGFFECIDDQLVANELFSAAADFLGSQGMEKIMGPYNPSGSEDAGILVEGFQSIPAMLEAHNPPYYQRLVENYGFTKDEDLLARLYLRDPAWKTFDEGFPEKVMRVAVKAAQRTDLRLRKINMDDYEVDIGIACRIFNAALISSVPNFVPVQDEEFQNLGRSLKSIIDPDLAMVAEVNGQPVGYALAFPDLNPALRHVNGRLNAIGLVKLWWHTFKILMMLPEFQYRGIEALLLVEVSKAIWRKGYQEIDMSLTGDKNIKSMRLQTNLGFKVYRRYRIYQREIRP
jgi:GNAT superfamily N-acetyltransferase